MNKLQLGLRLGFWLGVWLGSVRVRVRVRIRLLIRNLLIASKTRRAIYHQPVKRLISDPATSFR